MSLFLSSSSEKNYKDRNSENSGRAGQQGGAIAGLLCDLGLIDANVDRCICGINHGESVQVQMLPIPMNSLK